MAFRRAQRQGLAGTVGQDRPHDVAGGGRQQPLAFGPVDRTRPDRQLKTDLDVDLAVGAVDAARVVHEVGVAPSAAQGELDPGGVGEAEVAALGHDPAAQLPGVDPHPVAGLVPDRGVLLPAGLHPGAHATVPQQVDRCAQDRPDQGVGGQRVVADTEQLPDRLGQFDPLGRQRENAPAGRQQAAVVVVPAARRQRRQPAALLERPGRVGVGVEEDVPVVEGGHQPQMAGEQHPVAEDVAGHVTDADDGQGLAVGVDAELGEVPTHRLPHAAGGDAQRLVVVSAAAAGGERVAEPVAVRRRHLVGQVGEAGRALVGGDDQIGVGPVVADHPRPAVRLAVGPVVDEGQQRLHEPRVAGLGQPGEPPRVCRRAAQHEPALGPVRHDDGVLDPLGLHQTEDLGPQVLLTVGPADTAAGQQGAAQVHRVEPGGADEGLGLRQRPGQPRQPGRGELEGQRIPGAAADLVPVAVPGVDR